MEIDQSLDAIIANRPRGKTGVQKRRANAVKKPTTGPKANAPKAAPTGPAAASSAPVAASKGPAPVLRSEKIIVSGLPSDIGEKEIKEFFGSFVGAVRRVDLTYNSQGKSKGVATVIFASSASPQIAFDKYNGKKVDDRTLRIEIVYNPNSLKGSLASRIDPAAIQQVAAYGQELFNSNNTSTISAATANNPTGKKSRNQKRKEKKTAAAKTPGAPAPAATTGSKGAQAQKTNTRPKRVRRAKKSASELDQDMADYFGQKQAQSAS